MTDDDLFNRIEQFVFLNKVLEILVTCKLPLLEPPPAGALCPTTSKGAVINPNIQRA